MAIVSDSKRALAQRIGALIKDARTSKTMTQAQVWLKHKAIDVRIVCAYTHGMPRPNPLRAARLALGLTQVELSELANISQPTLSHAERGVPLSKESAYRVRKALGAHSPSLEWLLGFDRPKTPRRAA